MQGDTLIGGSPAASVASVRRPARVRLDEQVREIAIDSGQVSFDIPNRPFDGAAIAAMLRQPPTFTIPP